MITALLLAGCFNLGPTVSRFLMYRSSIKLAAGHIRYWRSFIESAHVSERVVKSGNFTNSEAEIQLTPIIKLKKDKSYKGELIKFSIKQELILHSMGWGKNTFLITAQTLKQVVEVQQSK